MSTIDIQSNEYPDLLRQINDPPPLIYYKGKWDGDIFKQTLSVVGSRRMTHYGETIAAKLIRQCAGCGITIVSGFMYGIDATAHEAAVVAGGRTIAVMPCGIERIHPEYQGVLYGKILETSGLIISEYPGDTPPALWTYPRRNRIIAGLSPALLVIEAGLKSGALITSRIAKKYNKKIFAVPGPLTSSVSLGTALLIKQGASIVTGVNDILYDYGKPAGGELFAKEHTFSLNPRQKSIINFLSVEPLSIDELTRRTKTDPSNIGAEITYLSLKKIINQKEGKYYLDQEDSHAY